MQQKWWLIAAGIVGIGLAILLFPKPDTGNDVPDPTPGRVDFGLDKPPGIADGARELKPANAKRSRPMAANKLLTPPKAVTNLDVQAVRGPNPIAAEVMRRRQAPESVYAGRASAPFSLIRRQLLLADTEESKELANEMGALISDLREQRRDPSAHDWSALEEQMVGYSKQMQESEWASDPHISQSVERLDSILDEYHEAAKTFTPED